MESWIPFLPPGFPAPTLLRVIHPSFCSKRAAHSAAGELIMEDHMGRCHGDPPRGFTAQKKKKNPQTATTVSGPRFTSVTQRPWEVCGERALLAVTQSAKDMPTLNI